MMITLERFNKIYSVDTEYFEDENYKVKVNCVVFKEIISGDIYRIHGEGLLTRPSFLEDKDALFIAFYASSEMKAFKSLGWVYPQNLICLYAEFRNRTNGLISPKKCSLIEALKYYGLPTINSDYKEEMRSLSMRGGPFTSEEMESLLDYCEGDVISNEILFNRIKNSIKKIDHALLRGNYTKSIALMEDSGIPIDFALYSKFVENYESIKSKLIEKIDKDYGVYDGNVFKYELFEKYLKLKSIEWPRLKSGKLDLKNETFKEMAKAYPELKNLRELRKTLDQMGSNKLQIGKDGRSRVNLAPFATLTGRNQPSVSKFILSFPAWMRRFIRCESGMVLLYLDYSQQEPGISAFLSNDNELIKAYCSGDLYLTFAKSHNAIPENATKHSHKAIRENYKQCLLGMNYGMGAKTLSYKIKKPIQEAEKLIAFHKSLYHEYWSWHKRCLNHAYLKKEISTSFGWTYHLTKDSKQNTLTNFPMQANGAEMLRLAIQFAFEKGIKVLAPLHDAILIEAPTHLAEEHAKIAKDCMEKASATILKGNIIKVDIEVFNSNERFGNHTQSPIWELVNDLLLEL